MIATLMASVSAPALASEWDVRVSGYGEYKVAFATSDVDNEVGENFDGVDIKQDVEIHFIPSIKLDNGITFGANVQLEGNTSSDSIDESFLFVKGFFGEINLGSENSAGYKLHIQSPTVLFFEPDDLEDFFPINGSSTFVNTGDDFTRGPFAETQVENDRNNDADRITYYTPYFFGGEKSKSGLRVGFSYARDGSQDSNAQVDIGDGTGELSNIFDIGAIYQNSFGGIDFGISGRWGTATRESGTVGGASTTPQVWAAGAKIGFAGFTIGGSFAEQNESGTEDGTGYQVGASYVFPDSPWSISAVYHHGENVDDEQPFAGADEEIDMFLAGARYKLAKGIDINLFGAYVSFEEDQGDFGFGGDDVDGWAIGSGLKIKF